MGHFERKGFQEVYVDSTGRYWGSVNKKVRLDENTWEPVSATSIPIPIPEVLVPAIPLPVLPDSLERIARRVELEKMDYPSIRRAQSEIKMTKGLTKRKLIETVLDKEGL